jgi:hypothetical protein
MKKNLVLMCDHGGEAQSQLAKVAKKMNKVNQIRQLIAAGK